MTPRTTDVGEKEQNVDAELSNGVLKRRLEQGLLLRGSRGFAAVEDRQAFVEAVTHKANTTRGRWVDAELAAMRELSEQKLPL